MSLPTTATYNYGTESHPSFSPSPELLHDSEEDDEDSMLSLYSRSSSFYTELPTAQRMRYESKDQSSTLGPFPGLCRRKSTPYKSPSAMQCSFQTSNLDKSIIFQLDTQYSPNSISSKLPCKKCGEWDDQCLIVCTSKFVSGESLLSMLRKRVAFARSRFASKKCHTQVQTYKKLSSRTVFRIKIPKSTVNPTNKLSRSDKNLNHNSKLELNSESDDDKMTDTAMATATVTATTVLFPTTPTATATATPELASETILISDAVSHSACDSSSNHTLHKLSKSARIKGPCQACNEVSDSCMRKAFNWPFPTTAVFLDKGRPFVYLCNKCGLRYNKSNGCICHHCRWVFCKEEKRKAAKFIENMRKSRPDGYVGPDEDIEGFVCIPKYWSCGKPWKVGWVLNDLEDQSEEDEFAI